MRRLESEVSERVLDGFWGVGLLLLHEVLRSVLCRGSIGTEGIVVVLVAGS